jgi:hypothetical protein
VVFSFTRQLGNWDADHAEEILKRNSIDPLTAYVHVGFSNKDLESKKIFALIILDQFDNKNYEYTQEFNNLYNYWKVDILIKVASYLYIGGFKHGSIRVDLMSNRQSRKYVALMALWTDDAKNNFWRSSIVITPGSGGTNTHQNKGKIPMTPPNLKRSQPTSFGQYNFGSHNNFGVGGRKGASSNKGPWGQSKSVKTDFKGPTLTRVRNGRGVILAEIATPRTRP